MKTIVITGATGGLGQALVRSFSQPENRLVLVGRDMTKLETLAEWCQTRCHSVHIVPCDFSTDSGVQMCLVALQQETIDVLIHNAGYGLYQYVHEFQSDAVVDLMRVNTLVPMLLTNALIEKMYQRGTGHIFFIASQAGKMTTPKSTVYSASKAGLIGYANGLRLEARPRGVHVTTVNPGPIATDFFNRADKTGQYVKAVGRVMLDADDVAQHVQASVGKQVREINLPKSMAFAAKQYALFPKIGDHLIVKLFDKK